MRTPLLAAFALAMGSASCAHIPGAPKPKDMVIPATPEASKGAKLIKLSENDPLGSLHNQIQSVRTEKVIIPTRLLRTLVANQKTASNQCKDLSLQLEALKNIDLEETGSNGVEPQ